MANHTKAVVTTDVQQKLLWDTIVDDGDNVGVDAWLQSHLLIQKLMLVGTGCE